MRKIVSGSLVFLVLFIAGCNKDDDPPTPEQLLTAAQSGWITIAFTIQASGGSPQDVYAQYQDCDKDDAVVFVSDGKYRIENPIKCDNSESAILESGTWTLTSDKKTLHFVPTGDSPYDATIVELTATQLKVTVQVQIGISTYTGTITSKPK